ncbi:hypothetical protein GGI04_004083 [Coemansia thaxteri]|nr:hypothetical protein GGI04_004083 [Coemansia thaxteri]
MSSLIRRMRYSEEDAIYQAQQSELQRIAQEEQRLAVQQQQQQQSLLQQSGFRYSRPIANASSISIPVAAAAAVPEPRRDTEALFLWIAVLYAGRADAGLRFWGRGDGTRVGLELDDRLAVFVRWGSDCREQGMIRGYFNMLSSLACGAQASACAYEFMRAAEGSMMSPSRAHVASNQAPLCSWSALFGAVGFYATQMRQGEADPLVVAPEMPEAEVGLLRSFLRLCGTVVRHSLVARTALYDSGEYQAVATMFSLLGCVVPVALKASLLDAIAAFGEADIAEDSAQADNVRQVVGEIARRNWGLLEQSQTLATTADADALRLARAGGEAEAERLAPRGLSIGRGAAGRHSRSGIAYELEEIEAAVETYPETRAFVRLVGSLIHVPASAAGVGDLSRDPALYSEAARSVPADLGSAYRVPGIGPYVGFVLDSVLLRAEQRAYRYASEKWSVYAGALDVVERSVATLDLSGGGGGGGSLRELVTHPGFEIAIRILCGSKLLDALLGVLGVGVDAVNAAAGGAESAMARAVLSALRILLRVLRVQDALLRHVIPRVLEAPGEVGLPLNLPRSLTTLEQLLLARRAAVVQVVAYVGCVASADVCLAAVKIVHILADSAAFSGVDDGAARGSALLTLNRLVGMVDASADSVRIQHAFIACLELRDGDGESDEDGDGDGAQAQAQAQAIRIAVLDLLLANITAAKPAPTIAHYLLGFGLARPATDELPDASQRATCLHAVLAQLRGGGPASARVAERCHHLVYRLCADPVTSDVTLRYLRAHENFFFAQLSAEEDEPMETPNASRVCAQLHARAWLWRGAALELHTLAQQDARTRARQLGEWLVGDAGGGGARDFLDARMRLLALLDAARSAVAGAAAALRRETEQQRVRDAAADADAMDLAMDGGGGGASDEAALGVDVASCVVANARGCAVYDLHALAALLRRGAQAAGGGAGAQAVIRRVVIRCFVANQERELHHASVGAVRAWRELAEVAVAHGFASGGGARPAFQLLRGVARVVAEPGADVGGGGADVVGVLAPTLALAAERLALELPQPPARELPVEPLLDAWRLLVAAALTPAAQSSLALRGNAYAAMLHFLRAARRAPISRLVAGVLDVLADSAMGDRLLESVSADAADASDAWKTVAFSLLDALAAVFGADARANRVVLFLARRNYVASFVGALLRRDDQAIAATLHPDPPSLNALYIYEAKMALFLRLAQRADGAERLMECGAIDVLADCAFLDRRPASSGAAAFADAFLPARAERFHQLLMPALRLMLALVARIGRDHVALWLRAARFVAQHHAVLEAVLKDAALPAAALTLPLLAEARAVAQLVASIARHRAVLDRAPAGPAHVGVAALHLPMLALLPKLGAGCAWARRLLPITDIERAQALVPSPASDADADAAAAADDVARTVFGQHAAAAVDAITQHVVAYAQAVTEPQPHQQQQLHALRPAFSWPIEHAREADYLPSLATLVAFVRRALAQIERRRASRRENLRLARNSAAELTTAELRRLVAASPHAAEASAADLGPAQMRALAASVLTAQAQDIARSVAMLLAAVEQALVLLWRHLAFFISPVSPDQEAAVAASARLMATVMPSAQERDSLRTDASIALPPLLSLLADLGLTADELPTAATHSSFIQMLVRRIKDLVLRDASSM